MSRPTTVRPASSEDLDGLTRVSVTVQQRHHEARPDLFVRADPTTLRRFFSDRLSDGSHILVAEVDGSPTGIGTLLMEGVAELASSLEVSTLRLDSWSFNEDAHAFFRARGFTPMNTVFERQLQAPAVHT